MLASRLNALLFTDLVSVSALAFNLRLTVEDSDEYDGAEASFLGEKLDSAFAFIESDTSRFYRSQSRVARTRRFCRELYLSANLQSIDSVTYLDSELVEQTVPVEQYTVLYSQRNTVDGIEFLDGFDYPALANRNDAVRINYTAGFSDAGSLPTNVRQAVLMLASHWYENRESTAFSGSGEVKAIPQAYESLIRSERVEAPIG